MKKWISYAVGFCFLAGAAIAGPYYAYPLLTTLTGAEIMGPVQSNGVDYSTTAGALAQFAAFYPEPFIPVSPTTGSTVSIPGSQYNTLITAAGGLGTTLAALTVSLPSGRPVGSQYEIVFNVMITNLTFLPAGGTFGGPTTVTSATHVKFCQMDTVPTWIAC